MSFLTKLVLLPVFLALVSSEYPFDVDIDIDFESPETWNDGSSYRLPEDFDPIHADIEVTPYFQTAPPGREPFTFDGVTTLEVRPLRDNITSLIIQDNVRSIISVTLRTVSGDIVETSGFQRIRQYQLLQVNLRDGLTFVNGQTYYVTIEYIGNINETPLTRGMFRGSYRDDAGNLHIGDRVREVFYQTPRMSAYLITIHISGQFTVLADNGDSVRSYRIIGRPNAQGQGAYALEVGPPITEWLEDYFEIPYYTMEAGMKNDQLASPDWASGATENWGLVSYREMRLLYEEGETNVIDRMAIGTITAHELAHKWFGNYITARWWNNVWINEGFASYFEYFAMNGIDPSMELEDQFNIMYVQSALSADASASTRALQHTVNSPTEVTGHFSGISYSKGASLLLMLKHFLSEDTFKRALHLFLVDRAYEYATPDDLYLGFARATAEAGPIIDNVDITEFMRYWVDEPGYPVLNVNVNMETGLMTLRQERFFISPSASQTTQVWPIPLTYTTGQNPNWNNLTPARVMTGTDLQIQGEAGHSWVIFNVQQKGIYRVNYDSHNWGMLASALRSDLSNIHHLNRAQIVDDVFALMRSSRMTYALGFQVLDFLKQDVSYYSWYPAVTGFNWIRNRFLHLPTALASFDGQLHVFLEAVINDLGYEVVPGEPLTRTLNRLYTLAFACNVGHSGCIEDSVQKWQAFRNGASVNPNLRRHVFCQGLRAGGYEDFQFLYRRRMNSNNQGDEVAMLRTLGCTSDETAIREYINMVLSTDVKAQDRLNAFTFLFMGNRNNARVALPTIIERIDEIRTAVVLPAWFSSLLSNLAAYLDEEGLYEMEVWLSNVDTTIPEFQVGLNAIRSARANMDWGSTHAEEILSAVGDSASAVVPFITLLFTTVIAMMLR